MTPQTQAEQKARELARSLQTHKLPSGVTGDHPAMIEWDKRMDELKLLIQKADALDWLREFGQVSFTPDLISGKPNQLRYNISFPTEIAEIDVIKQLFYASQQE